MASEVKSVLTSMFFVNKVMITAFAFYGVVAAVGKVNKLDGECIKQESQVKAVFVVMVVCALLFPVGEAILDFVGFLRWLSPSIDVLDSNYNNLYGIWTGVEDGDTWSDKNWFCDRCCYDPDNKPQCCVPASHKSFLDCIQAVLAILLRFLSNIAVLAFLTMLVASPFLRPDYGARSLKHTQNTAITNEMCQLNQTITEWAPSTNSSIDFRDSCGRCFISSRVRNNLLLSFFVAAFVLSALRLCATTRCCSAKKDKKAKTTKITIENVPLLVHEASIRPPSVPSKMQERLSTYGLELRPHVGGGGNCQFRAVADLLLHDKEKHAEPRERAVQWLRANERTELQPGDSKSTLSLFGAGVLRGGESWNDYCDRMAKDGEWGDHLTLIALANACDVVFNVLTDLDVKKGFFDPVTVIEPIGGGDGKDHFWLAHFAELHYESAEPGAGHQPDVREMQMQLNRRDKSDKGKEKVKSGGGGQRSKKHQKDKKEKINGGAAAV